jgi:predicted CxxxxCH...CXXCH cytochrome family protein
MSTRHLVAILLLFGLLGCSEGNQGAPILNSAGKHPSGWVDSANGGNHPATYLTSPGRCFECHGEELTGGISKVSCFSSDRNGIGCHAVGPQGHAADFRLPENHGRRAKAVVGGVNGMAFCKNCHGNDFRGAGSTRKDCIGCHQLTDPTTRAPHSPQPWRGDKATHINTDQSNVAVCGQCHTGGANLRAQFRLASYSGGAPGCFNNTLCHGVIDHSNSNLYPAPWANPGNHGRFARNDPSLGGINGLAFCQRCHGATFSGGSANLSCYPCHGASAPHPKKTAWALAAGTLSHVNAGQGNAGICHECHSPASRNLSEPYLTRFASSPAGSFSATGSPGCFNASICHGDVQKTSDCDACHGTAGTSPFKSMAGSANPANAIVGAHTKHLGAAGQTNPFSADIACGECHSVPTTPVISGSHRNGATDISFGTLAKTGGLTPTVSRDAVSGALVCSNTYCHGATLAGGTNRSPRWNQTDYLTAAGCGTCHGYPPATPAHSFSGGPTSCVVCHPHVNASGTGFTDVTKHINGSIEDRPHGFPFPGSAHKTASNGIGCIANGCHGFGAAGASPYPVASGTPPDCRACHLNVNPTIDPRCTDCHGNLISGQPAGATFPNRRGQHFVMPDLMTNCDYCHFGGGSGASTHGNSGGKVKTVLDVTIAKNPALFTAADTIVMVQDPLTGTVTCTNTCHIGSITQLHNFTW